MNKVVAATLLLHASSLCFADWKFETHTTTESDASPQVRITYVKGQRVRNEVPNTGKVTIFQCDQNRSVTINTFDKTFTAVSLSQAGSAGEAMYGNRILLSFAIRDREAGLYLVSAPLSTYAERE